jgi:hypothetical protein
VQLKDFWAVLRRRWYLVLASVVCAAAAASLVVFAVGPTYKAQGSVLLLPPGTTVKRASDSKVVGNPWLSLGGVSQARDVVIRALMASKTHETLCQQEGDAAYQAMRAVLCDSHPDVSYEVEQDFISSAPMILISVEANSPANAVTALDAVADLVPKTLADLQEGLKLRPGALITSMPVAIDQKPTVEHKDQIRAGIVAGGGTLGLALLLIALIDGVLGARRTGQVEVGEEELAEAPVDLNWAQSDAEPDDSESDEEKPQPVPPLRGRPAPVSGWEDEVAGERVPVKVEPAEAWPLTRWSLVQSEKDESEDRDSNDEKPRPVTALRGRPAPVSHWGDDMAAGQRTV